MNSGVGERGRILAEYLRREREVDATLYAPWVAAHAFMQSTARRTAAQMLYRAGVFPNHEAQCMEIGFGYMGWLADLIRWGIPERNLHGIELNEPRADRARQILPVADLRIGDAVCLPWKQDMFQLVVASTVFTSILDAEMRRKIAAEISRVLAPGGALLWYDFAVNNPSNQNVRKVDRSELGQLFSTLQGEIKSVTLAPPLARLVAPRSVALAMFLEAIPWLRTHLIAVLVKPALSRNLRQTRDTKVPMGVVESDNGNAKALLSRGRGFRDLNYLLLKAQQLAATKIDLSFSRKPPRIHASLDSCAEPESLPEAGVMTSGSALVWSCSLASGFSITAGSFRY